MGIACALLVVPLSAATSVTERLNTNLAASQPFEGLSAAAPSVSKPDWYNRATITYNIRSNGSIRGSVSEFATQSNSILNDSRGWSQLGTRFKQVESGGMFNLILAQASLLPSYSSGCSADWSCRAGNNVIINDDRWMGATTSWNAAGGSLTEYRQMVVNHEVGHWLGHNHSSCGGPGQPAPLMQQQSMDLQGCVFNPWPKADELWSNRL